MGSRHRSTARWVPVALAPVAVLYAVTAIGVAIRHGDPTTYAGRSAAAAAVELAAGLMLIAAGLVALTLDATCATFIDTCFNYPTLSDMYKYAAYDAMGRISRGEMYRP